MTPEEREVFDLLIYLESKKHRGCISDAADYLRLPDPSRVSCLINPNEIRAKNIFGETMDMLEAFNHKHPLLAKFIWSKMVMQVNSFMKFATAADIPLDTLIDIADSAVREQFDVNRAISSRMSPEEIELQAFQAFEASRKQYELAQAFNKNSKSPPEGKQNEQP